MQQVGLSLKVLAISPVPVGKVVISQQQPAEGSSMTQRREQSPPWEHCGWLCFAQSGRAAETVDMVAVLIWTAGRAPCLKRGLSTEYMNGSEKVT